MLGTRSRHPSAGAETSLASFARAVCCALGSKATACLVQHASSPSRSRPLVRGVRVEMGFENTSDKSEVGGTYGLVDELKPMLQKCQTRTTAVFWRVKGYSPVTSGRRRDLGRSSRPAGRSTSGGWNLSGMGGWGWGGVERTWKDSGDLSARAIFGVDRVLCEGKAGMVTSRPKTLLSLDRGSCDPHAGVKSSLGAGGSLGGPSDRCPQRPDAECVGLPTVTQLQLP